MAFCSKCGKEIPEDAKFCVDCGASVDENKTTGVKFDDVKEKFENFNNTADTTNEFSTQDIDDNKIFAVLAYFGILVLIPIFAAKDSKFAKFHSNQGLVLWLSSIIISVAMGIITGILGTIFLFIGLGFLTAILGLLSAAVGITVLAFAVIGIVNAATGKAKELPVIGKFRLIK